MVATLLYLLRQLERWLHQHIFKVGWLFTRNLQTTTTLYYAFFLPGIFLNEVVRWMVAGLLDIRAERTFEWPQQQDIGELKLNFIRIHPKAPSFAVALINTVPVIVGLLIISWIANNNLALPAFIAAISSGILADIGPAFTRLTTAADFWLWFYLAFTIGNTMLPDVQRLRGWRIALPITGIVTVVVVIAGAGNEFITNVMNGPVADSLNALAGVLGAIIVLNVMGVAILGTIEALVERITGNSATFKDNKMIVMTRAELLQQREETFQAERKRLSAPTSRKAALPAPTNLSIYSFPFPIPGAPGKEPVRTEASVILTGGPAPTPQPALPAREEPKVIPGTTVESPAGAAAGGNPVLAKPVGTSSAPPFGSNPAPPRPMGTPTPTARPMTPSSPTGGNPSSAPPRPGLSSPASGGQSAAPARPIAPTGPPATNPQPRPSFPALPTGANRPAATVGGPPKPFANNPVNEDEDDEDEVRYVDLEDSP